MPLKHQGFLIVVELELVKEQGTLGAVTSQRWFATGPCCSGLQVTCAPPLRGMHCHTSLRHSPLDKAEAFQVFDKVVFRAIRDRLDN